MPANDALRKDLRSQRFSVNMVISLLHGIGAGKGINFCNRKMPPMSSFPPNSTSHNEFSLNRHFAGVFLSIALHRERKGRPLAPLPHKQQDVNPSGPESQSIRVTSSLFRERSGFSEGLSQFAVTAIDVIAEMHGSVFINP
jgi:hypothetical protein